MRAIDKRKPWSLAGRLLCVVLGAGAGLSGRAAAVERDVRLGDLVLRLDDTRWRATPDGEDGLELVARSTTARDDLKVKVARHHGVDGNACAVTARRLLPGELYAALSVSAAQITTRGAQKFVASTRCRNATPRGVVLCVSYKDSLYTLSQSQASCRSGTNPFSSVDWLADLAASVSFVP